MDHALSLISNRREEVLKVIKEAEAALATARLELQELEVAGKTVASLTGAEWVEVSQVDAAIAPPPQAVRARVRPPPEPPVTQMILAILQDEPEGMVPKDVRAELVVRFNKEVRGEYVSAQMWRMASKGTLNKLEDGRYCLPT